MKRRKPGRGGRHQEERRTNESISAGRQKSALERETARGSKTNPKSFYSYINRARRNHSEVGPFMINGQLVVHPKEKSNTCNQYFSSVFTRCNVDPPTKEPLTGIDVLENVRMTEECIKNEIGHIREHSAPGPDDVTNRTLNEIAKPLAILFTKSMENGRIPDDWRLSNVTPIYKGKGSKSQPGNYRPVGLTSSVYKLMEKVVNRELSNHLEKGVLSNSQHGFRRGRSC